MSWEVPTVLVPMASGEPVRLVLAGLPRRLLALGVDGLLQAVVLGAFALVAGLLSRLAPQLGSEADAAESVLIGGVVLALAGVVLLWPALFEMRWAGVTPGKRVAGIRVVDRDGGRPTAAQILVRNLLRVADLAPGAGLVGLVSAFADPLGRRLGDLAAGTLVVLDHPLIEQPSRHTRDVDLARQLLERWDRLDEGERIRLAAALGDRFRERGADPHLSDRAVLRQAVRAGSAARR